MVKICAATMWVTFVQQMFYEKKPQQCYSINVNERRGRYLEQTITFSKVYMIGCYGQHLHQCAEWTSKCINQVQLGSSVKMASFFSIEQFRVLLPCIPLCTSKIINSMCPPHHFHHIWSTTFWSVQKITWMVFDLYSTSHKFSNTQDLYVKHIFFSHI